MRVVSVLVVALFLAMTTVGSTNAFVVINNPPFDFTPARHCVRRDQRTQAVTSLPSGDRNFAARCDRYRRAPCGINVLTLMKFI